MEQVIEGGLGKEMVGKTVTMVQGLCLMGGVWWQLGKGKMEKEMEKRA